MEAQLLLFARLCMVWSTLTTPTSACDWLFLQGNNESAIKQLRHNPDARTGYVSFNEAFKCAQSQKIHPKLKLRYVELILVMFVAVGENRSFLDHLCYSFVSCNFQQLAAWWSCQFKLDQLQ